MLSEIGDILQWISVANVSLFVVYIKKVYKHLLLNKMLGRALDPRANGTWLSKRTE